MYEITFEPITQPEIPEGATPQERNRLADEWFTRFMQKRESIIGVHESLAQEYAESLGCPLWEKRYELTFSEAIEIDQNSRKKVTDNAHTVKLFVASNGQFAYTFHKRTGYKFTAEMTRNLIRMRLITQNFYQSEKDRKLERILSSFHSNVWTDLKHQIRNDPESRRYYGGVGLSLLDMRRRFPEHVIQNLENAFRNLEDFSYQKPGTRRDLRVSTKMCDDGVFRAWYSSEYAGTGNGQYYVLINPHYATFMTWD